MARVQIRDGPDLFDPAAYLHHCRGGRSVHPDTVDPRQARETRACLGGAR